MGFSNKAEPSPPPPVDSRYSLGWMAKDEKAILEGNAGSGAHMVKRTVYWSTASMVLNRPPYSQSGAESDIGSKGTSVATGGASVSTGGCAVALGWQAESSMLKSSRPAIRMYRILCF